MPSAGSRSSAAFSGSSADLRRRDTLWGLRWWAALLFGMGGFQLYDGTIQHKLLGLHQIRYQVTIWPYDLVWNLLAVIAIVVGFVLLRRSFTIARSRNR
jgi:uncharacterized membrane protein